MLRLLFEKTGRAVWISHLDLMRVFQRAFKRAGLPLTHTQGFNPRPSVSIALPLSVGTQSYCELLDFELDGVDIPCEEILLRLNNVLIDGIRVKQVYHNGRKLKEIAFLRTTIELEYDNALPTNAVNDLKDLFHREVLLVPKKTKNGIQDQDVIPMIHSLEIDTSDVHRIVMEATVCCQNPSLNPMQLVAAIERHLPDLQPDHAQCCRMEILDHNNEVFR